MHKQCISDPWDNMKHFNIGVIGGPEKKREGGRERDRKNI